MACIRGIERNVLEKTSSLAGIHAKLSERQAAKSVRPQVGLERVPLRSGGFLGIGRGCAASDSGVEDGVPRSDGAAHCRLAG